MEVMVHEGNIKKLFTGFWLEGLGGLQKRDFQGARTVKVMNLIRKEET